MGREIPVRWKTTKSGRRGKPWAWIEDISEDDRLGIAETFLGADDYYPEGIQAVLQQLVMMAKPDSAHRPGCECIPAYLIRLDANVLRRARALAFPTFRPFAEKKTAKKATKRRKR